MAFPLRASGADSRPIRAPAPDFALSSPLFTVL